MSLWFEIVGDDRGVVTEDDKTRQAGRLSGDPAERRKLCWNRDL